jgi:hypothetical protein
VFAWMRHRTTTCAELLDQTLAITTIDVAGTTIKGPIMRDAQPGVFRNDRTILAVSGPRFLTATILVVALLSGPLLAATADVNRKGPLLAEGPKVVRTLPFASRPRSARTNSQGRAFLRRVMPSGRRNLSKVVLPGRPRQPFVTAAHTPCQVSPGAPATEPEPFSGQRPLRL